MSGLPRGWAEAQIADIYDVARGGSPRPIKEYLTGDSNGLNWIRIGDASAGGYRIKSAEQKIDKRGLNKTREIYPGDLLLSNSMSFGRPYISDIRGCIHDGWLVLGGVGKHYIDTEFAFRCLSSSKVQRQFNEKASGTTVRNLNTDIVNSVQIEFPPLAEQKRIVAKLDALSAKSARARAELARIETLVSRYKQAVLSKAFSGELTADWQMKTVGEVAEVVFDGPFGSNLKSVDYTDEGPRVIRLENIGFRTFVEEKRTHISEEKFSTLRRHELRPNDLLFSSFVSEEVRACLFPSGLGVKAINKADCFCVRLNADVVAPQFLLLQLTSEATYRFFVNQVHGATRPRINLKQLKQFEILVPTIDEQKEIVRRIESAFAKIDRLAAEAKRALELVGKLDEAILAKAFRGELVPQDEKDEPASVLLERIRAERESAPKVKRGRRS